MAFALTKRPAERRAARVLSIGERMEDVRALFEVTRRETKSTLSRLRTLTQLYARLDERFDELASLIDNDRTAEGGTANGNRPQDRID